MSGDDVLRSATSPTEAELARLTESPGWAELAAHATAPAPTELTALLARAPGRRAPRRWPIAAALAAAAIALLVLWPTAETPLTTNESPPSATTSAGDVLLLDGTLTALNPSIAVEGNATLVVDTVSAAGLEIGLLAGRAVFEVDPQGDARALRVVCDDVWVEVTGTRFLVAREDGEVHIAVERGSVNVAWSGTTVALAAGERWVRPAPPPPPAPSAPTVATPPPAPPQATGAAPNPAPAHEPPAGADAARAWTRLLDERDAGAPWGEQLAALEVFLASWPDSPLRSEAALLRLEILADAAPPELAVTAIDAWLKTDPPATTAARARLLRALVQHERLGDCVAALPDYAWASERAGGEVRARAETGLARCVEQLATAEP